MCKRGRDTGERTRVRVRMCMRVKFGLIECVGIKLSSLKHQNCEEGMKNRGSERVNEQ